MRHLSLVMAWCGLSSLISISPSSGDANLVVNGSFERPRLSSDNPIRVILVGHTFHGWTVTGPNRSLGILVINENYVESGGVHFSPRRGAQSADLSGPRNEGPLGVVQTVPTTAGSPYRLTFSRANQDDAGPLYPDPSKVEVFINGVSQGVFVNDRNTPNDLTWKKFTIQFNAATDATTVQFVNRTPASDNECGLDTVSLTPVIAPGED